MSDETEVGKYERHYFKGPPSEATMLRIGIRWTDRMLMIGAAACNIKVEQLNPLTANVVEVLFKGRGKIERHSIGYDKCEFAAGVTQELFDDHIKPHLDCMMRSYRQGMTLEDEDYHWIQDWRKVDW